MAKTSKPTKGANPPSASLSRQPWLASRWFPWALAGTYLAILLVLFRDFVFSDRMLYGSDTMQAMVYFRELYVGAVKRGVFPLWSPYLYGGMPFVDAFHSDIFYPFTFIKFLLPLGRSRGWEVISHLLLGGMGMYAAARGWKMSRPSAALCGLAYMLAPYFVSMVHPGHDGKLYVTAWFPLGFLFLKRIWDQAAWRDAAVFALIVGFIILTPHVQMAYFSLWAYAAYSLYRIIASLREHRKMPWKAAAGSLAAVVAAVAISAVQFYPSYDYVKNFSPRAGEGRGFEYAASWSLHPEELGSEIIPEFSGVADSQSNSYWGRNAFKDNSEYGGLIALLLAGFAVFGTTFRDRWIFFGMGLTAALYALGAHTPVFTAFYYLVPNVKHLRAPSMIMFVYVFSIVLCAGAALDALLERTVTPVRAAFTRRYFWIAASVLGALALVMSMAPQAMLSIYKAMVYSDITPDKQATLDGHRDAIVLACWLAALLGVALAFLTGKLRAGGGRWVLLGLALLVVIDTARMDRRFIATVDLNRYFPPEPVVGFLKAQEQPIRILPAPGGFRVNYFALNEIQEMSGYHGNQLRSYNDFLGGPDQPRMYSQAALDLASIDYLVFRRNVNLNQDPDLPQVEKVFDQGGVVVFRNHDALPRARLVAAWELRKNTDSLCERLFDPTFDYRRTALVDEPLPFASRDRAPDSGEVHIESYDLNRVQVQVKAADTSLLVLADNYYPAWKATVNGQSAPVIRTNATFRGVVVPPGTSVVSFEYHSERLRVGLLTSLIAALTAAMVAGVGFWPFRRKPS